MILQTLKAFTIITAMIGLNQANTQNYTYIKCDVQYRGFSSPSYFRIGEKDVAFLNGPNWMPIIDEKECRSLGAFYKVCEMNSARIFLSVDGSRDGFTRRWEITIDRREGKARSRVDTGGGVSGDYDTTGACTRLERDPAAVAAF